LTRFRRSFSIFLTNTSGDALVEAAILFPIMIMIFAALVLLAAYLPNRAALQRATQYAATAIATESSDAWLRYDDSSLSYYWETDNDNRSNVYVSLFSSVGDIQAKGEDIVVGIDRRLISSKSGELIVNCQIVNRVIYKEVVVTAAREIKSPVNLSFVGFPEAFLITVTSTAVVQNGDEFVRNTDLASDFTDYIFEEFELTNITDGISTYWDKAKSFLGI